MTIISVHEDGKDDGCEKSKDDYYCGLLSTITGCPRKSTFLKFQVYKSIYDYSGPLCTLVRECNVPFRYFGQLWTVGPFHTILFVWLARNCHVDL